MPRNVFDPNETLSSIQSKRRNFDTGYQNKALSRMRSACSVQHQRVFDTITGRDDGPIHALCCNGQATEIVRNGLINAMLCLNRQDNGQILRMVTIFNSPWRSGLYNTEIDLTDIQKRMRAVIDGCNFDGAFLKIEIQIARDPIDRSFWTFPHAHGLALVSEDFEPRKTAERINNGGRLTHFNGADCLQISNRLQSEADIARVCAYSVKEPYSGMDFNPLTGKPDRSIGLMTGERCLRTTELLSSLRYNDVLIASGDLKGVRPRILRQLGPQKELQRTTDTAGRQAQDLWVDLHSAGLRGNEVVVNRGSALPRSSRTAGVMPVERRLSWATPSDQKRPRALSHNPDRSTRLFNAATMLAAPSLRTDGLGEFPEFNVAFTGRDDGIMHDVEERLRRAFSPRDANLPFSSVAGRRARAAVRACCGTANVNVDGVNLPARLLLTAKLMRAARALVRADLELDVRLGELRHAGWQRPLGQDGIDFDQVLTNASGVLRRFGFAGAWSSVNLRLAEADGTLLIAPAVRFIGWGGSSASVAAGFDAIACERLLLTPDGDPERGLMSRPIEEEETMFRAIAFALEQRFGLLDRIDGVIIPRDVWGDGVGRAYDTQTDIDMRYATEEQLGGLRNEMIGIPLSELIRANGSGRSIMDRAITAVGRTLKGASTRSVT